MNRANPRVPTAQPRPLAQACCGRTRGRLNHEAAQSDDTVGLPRQVVANCEPADKFERSRRSRDLADRGQIARRSVMNGLERDSRLLRNILRRPGGALAVPMATGAGVYWNLRIGHSRLDVAARTDRRFWPAMRAASFRTLRDRSLSRVDPCVSRDARTHLPRRRAAARDRESAEHQHGEQGVDKRLPQAKPTA